MKNKLPRNFKVKLLSLLVAFGMWIYVMEEIDPIMIRTLENVPIGDITNMAEVSERGLTLSYGQSLTVGIDLRGKRSYLLSYLNTDIKPKAYIENPKVGQNIVNISLTPVNGVEYSFNPRVFSINLEESIIEEKKLEISTTGEPKENFFVGSIELNKQSVYIEGAKSQIDKVEKVAGSVNVENASKDFSQRIQLTPVDANGQTIEGISISGSIVVAEVTIEKSKEVDVKLVLVNSMGEIISTDYLKTELEKTTITGNPDLIDTINELQTTKIRIADFNQNPDKKFELEQIKGIKIDSSRTKLVKNPEVVETEFTLEIDKNSLIFLGEHDKEALLEALPDTITVSFKSAEENLDKINEDTIRLYIDEPKEGAQPEIKLSIEYPVTQIKVEPSHVNIN